MSTLKANRIENLTTTDGGIDINNSGNVGIGVSSPDEDLHVYSSTGAIKIDGSGDTALRFATSGTNKFSIFHSSDTLRFFDNSNSAERMRIDSSGNVQVSTGQFTVGTTASTGLQFINDGTFGTINSADLKFRTASAERMRIDTSGRLLVGTTSASSTATSLLLQGSPDGASGPSYLRIATGTATPGSTSTIGQISFTDSGHSTAASIIAFRDGGSWSSSSKPTKITFSTTANGASSATERMVINSSGNVGINATSPDARLHVSGAYNQTGLKVLGGGAGYSSPLIVGAANGTEYMRVDDDGRVLIGTTSAPDSGATRSVQVVNTSTATLSLGRNDGTISAGNDIGAIRFWGNAGSSYQQCAEILAEADGTHANNDKPTRLVFSTTASSGSSPIERMRITKDGHLLLGQSTTQVPGLGNTTVGCAYEHLGPNGGAFFASRAGGAAYFANRNSDGTVHEFLRSGSVKGSITVNSSSTAFNTSSDYRLKENVVDIADGITRVKQLAPKRFNFIADADTTVDGFLAHEAQAVVPEAVTGEKDGEEMQGIDQSKLVPLLTAALQEAIAKIETLETKVAALEAAE